MSGRTPTRGDRGPARLDRPTDPPELTCATASVAPPGAPLSPGPMETRPLGTRAGRYLLLEHLGRGGMGVVYKAYDPDLDRAIALKVMQVPGHDSARAAQARARLVREAQALAKLSHPNVVAAFDVGTIDDDIFIAMELVEGRTLKRWLREQQPDLRRILSVLIAAGRGLAAAHDAGLVHRDFKPDNVIVGDDGRVRVIDFGLARAESPDDEQTEAERTASADSGDSAAGDASDSGSQAEPTTSLSGSLRVSGQVTVAGAVMGTPAYMAPEQYAGLPLNAQTDQFAFCVTAHEALYGERPFVKQTGNAAREGVLRRRLADVPADSRVPRRLRRILLRGLATLQSDRYPSMRALLADLAHDPRVGAMRAAVAVTLAVLAALAIYGLARAPAAQPLCAGLGAKLDGVWDRGVERSMRAAFSASGRAHAGTAADKASALLDRYASQWVDMSTDACEATHVRGEQSPRLLDLRMTCLDRRRDQLAQLTALLSDAPSSETVDHAIRAVLRLPPLATCADEQWLTAEVPPPDDPQTRARVRELQQLLDRANALEHTGNYRRGIDVAVDVLGHARQVGYRPLEAESLLRLGRMSNLAGEYRDALPVLREAIDAAADAHDDDMVAQAWTLLIHTLALLGRYPDALAELRSAEVVIRRAGGAPSLEARLGEVMGTLYLQWGKLAEAQQAWERTLAVRRKLLPEDAEGLANALTGLGAVLVRRTMYAQALPYHEESLGLRTAVFGDRHPMVAAAMANVGICLYYAGQGARASQYFRDALTIAEETLGPDHPNMAHYLNNVANDALTSGDVATARRYAARMVAIQERAVGPAHPQTGFALISLGETLLAGGKLAEARSALERAVGIFDDSLDQAHPYLAHALVPLAEAELGQDRSAAAVVHAQRALAILRRLGVEPIWLGRVRFVLARALWKSGHRGARARQLAEQARRDFQTAIGSIAEHTRVEIDAWLAGAR